MKYPVVDPDPSMSKIVSNFDFQDVGAVVFLTTAGFVVGWFGARKPLRQYNSQLCAGIGLMAGMTYGLLGSSQRLAGLEPNESEVRRYGFINPDQLKARNAKLAQPNIEFIDSNAGK